VQEPVYLIHSTLEHLLIGLYCYLHALTEGSAIGWTL